MTGIISAFTGDFGASKKTASVIIAPLDRDGKIDDDLGGAKVLQYWPESLEITKSQGWQEKPIPGMNLPLYQWTGGGGRSISFTAVFSRDMDGDIKKIKEDKHNVDIDAAIAWLNLLSSSDYEDLGDMQVAVAPPILWMAFMGSSIGYSGATGNSTGYKGDIAGLGVHCILPEVGESRLNWFPSGRPRFAEVSLSFNEVIQVGQDVIPYGRDTMKNLAANYTRTTE